MEKVEVSVGYQTLVGFRFECGGIYCIVISFRQERKEAKSSPAN
jgi:hypothetical protein